MSTSFTYQKKDKLKSRKQTQFLFAKGQSMNAFPIKLIYTIEQLEPDESPALGTLQAGVGAPSRTFRKAVARNRVKRLLREGYRLERPAFVEAAAIKGLRINLFFLYTDATVITQAAIQEKIKQLLARLAEKINSTRTS
ncbi:MAG: ribonuclease P protein component [Sediminibacterium sp.]